MVSLIKEWLSYCSLRYSEATYKTYRSAILNFLDSLPLKIQPNKIQTIHIEKFLQHTASSYKISTANTYLMAVKSFFVWAKSYNIVDNNVTIPVTKLREPKHNIRVLSDIEYHEILRVTKGFDKDAIQFLANTGLRRNEFRYLHWDNFKDDYVHIVGKGSKNRLVPLNEVCRTILVKSKNKKNMNNDIPLFVLPFQHHHAIYRLCTGISQKANIERFTPHTLRHYFATRLIRANIPLIIVSRLLGHSSTQITERIYIHLAPIDLRVTEILVS